MLIYLILFYRFYEVNDVSEFTLRRPFHKGKKDKDNEFAVCNLFLFTQPPFLYFKDYQVVNRKRIKFFLDCPENKLMVIACLFLCFYIEFVD